MRLRRTICFRNSLGTLVRFSFQREWWAATVLPRALRFNETAASLQCLRPEEAEVSGHAPQPLERSGRIPTGGGTLVRFDFQKVGRSGWICTST